VSYYAPSCLSSLLVYSLFFFGCRWLNPAIYGVHTWPFCVSSTHCFTTVWSGVRGVSCPYFTDGEDLHIWRLVASMLKTQSRTVDGGWSFTLGIRQEANNFPAWKILVTKSSVLHFLGRGLSIRMIKSKRMRWSGHVTRIGGLRSKFCLEIFNGRATWKT
jgi:hypothetical protein